MMPNIILDDAYHRAASYLTEEDLASGKSYKIQNKDGTFPDMIKVEGEVNGNKGVFEIILDEDGNVSHQQFIPGGKMDPPPNAVSEYGK